MKKGKLLIISGFSGVGKGTVVKALIDKHVDYKVSISATTRQPRPGEQDGIHYFFKSIEEFEDMIDNEQLLEYASYVNNYYGTPKEFVTKYLDSGINVILEIETQGALKVKEKIPEALLIFILPPDGETLKQRLIGRNTESPQVIKDRLLKAADETCELGKYEYFVINDEIDKCVENINKIVTENSPEILQSGRILEIKNDILRFSKGE